MSPDPVESYLFSIEEWSDIDFENRAITVQNKEEWHTKNYESREIPMNNTLYEALRRYPRNISSQYVFCNPSNLDNALVRRQRSGKGLPSYTSR